MRAERGTVFGRAHISFLSQWAFGSTVPDAMCLADAARGSQDAACSSTTIVHTGR